MRVYRVRGPLLALLVVVLVSLVVMSALYLRRERSREVVVALSPQSKEQERISRSRKRAQVIQRQILASQSSDMDLRSTVSSSSVEELCSDAATSEYF